MLTHPIPPTPTPRQNVRGRRAGKRTFCSVYIGRSNLGANPNPRGNLRDRRAGKRTFCSVYNGRNTLARASLRPTGANKLRRNDFDCTMVIGLSRQGNCPTRWLEFCVEMGRSNSRPFAADNSGGLQLQCEGMGAHRRVYGIAGAPNAIVLLQEAPHSDRDTLTESKQQSLIIRNNSKDIIRRFYVHYHVD